MSRFAVHAVVLFTVIASSGAAVVHLAVTQDNTSAAQGGVARVRTEPAASGTLRYERLTAPARTVVRDERGAIVATFTDGARTAVVTGPTRTFQEPTRTPSVVTTPAWVRLTPQPWQADAERADWFRPWLTAARADHSDDVLAIATQYLDGAPPVSDDKSVRFRGDASFGRADFLDYLGTNWTFPDGSTATPAPDKYGALDAAGFVRLVYGYRLGYPLQGRGGAGLPRSPAAMTGLGTQITTDRLALQPGDLLFFDAVKRGKGEIDHVGIFLGLDQDGRPRFISSRKRTAGPTLGDDSSLALRGARRL